LDDSILVWRHDRLVNSHSAFSHSPLIILEQSNIMLARQQVETI